MSESKSAGGRETEFISYKKYERNGHTDNVFSVCGILRLRF